VTATTAQTANAVCQIKYQLIHVKNRFRHKKLRYRGLQKNTAQLYTLFALTNLVIVKQALLVRPGG
jgi:transposase, IS5 family